MYKNVNTGGGDGICLPSLPVSYVSACSSSAANVSDYGIPCAFSSAAILSHWIYISTYSLTYLSIHRPLHIPICIKHRTGICYTTNHTSILTAWNKMLGLAPSSPHINPTSLILHFLVLLMIVLHSTIGFSSCPLKTALRLYSCPSSFLLLSCLPR